MSIRSVVAAFSLVVALAPVLAAGPAWAGDKEPVTLEDGTTGMAEVLSTEPDSLRVKVVRKGVEIEAVVPALRLDPYSFYDIRRRHMESTPENHVRLAVHCVENGLLNQARFQMETARALDPDIEQKFKDRPDVMESIAVRLVEAAKRKCAAGEYAAAYDIVLIVATRFTDTAAAAGAHETLDRIETKLAEREAAAVAARQKKVADAKDAAQRAAAEKREAVVAGIEKQQAAARKLESAALRQTNSNNAKTGHEAAADAYDTVLAATVAAKAAAGADAELVAMLREIEDAARSECADALVNAGALELPRSNFDRAEAFGVRAQKTCPESARATRFLEAVDIAREQADEFRRLKEARARRAGER